MAIRNAAPTLNASTLRRALGPGEVARGARGRLQSARFAAFRNPQFVMVGLAALGIAGGLLLAVCAFRDSNALGKAATASAATTGLPRTVPPDEPRDSAPFAMIPLQLTIGSPSETRSATNLPFASAPLLRLGETNVALFPDLNSCFGVTPPTGPFAVGSANSATGGESSAFAAAQNAFVAVPEPSTFASLFFGGVLLRCAARRRRPQH